MVSLVLFCFVRADVSCGGFVFVLYRVCRLWLALVFSRGRKKCGGEKSGAAVLARFLANSHGARIWDVGKKSARYLFRAREIFFKRCDILSKVKIVLHNMFLKSNTDSAHTTTFYPKDEGWGGFFKGATPKVLSVAVIGLKFILYIFPFPLYFSYLFLSSPPIPFHYMQPYSLLWGRN